MGYPTLKCCLCNKEQWIDWSSVNSGLLVHCETQSSEEGFCYHTIEGEGKMWRHASSQKPEEGIMTVRKDTEHLLEAEFKHLRSVCH